MKNYLVEYYDNTSQYYGSYHNHKEISAWAGLVLHMLFCQSIIQVGLPQNQKIIGAASYSIVMFIAALFVFLYIQNQLLMKDRAGALAGAAKYILAEIIQKEEQDLDVSHYMAIEESSDVHAQSSHVLPHILLSKSEVMNIRARGFQDKTKWMVYTLLWFSACLTIGFKWLVALT